MLYEVITVVEDADGHAVLEIYDGGDTNVVQGSITFRITSYNVCYTKLLRTS